MNYDLSTAFNVKYCSVCGKDFVVNDSKSYTYKRRKGHAVHYYCSYSHFKQGEKK